MPIFAVRAINDFDTPIPVVKLLRDGRCFLDDFISEVEGTNLEKELGNLYQIIEDVASGRIHPKYKKLKLSSNCPIAGYEGKSKHLRIYLFHEQNTGRIVVCAGKKKDQKKDIQRFERILKEYYDFKRQAS
jgi:hypothetical protein